MKNQQFIPRPIEVILSLSLCFFLMILSTGCQKENTAFESFGNERESSLISEQAEEERDHCNGISITDGNGGNVSLVHVTEDIEHLQYWNENTQQMEWICAPAYYGQNVPPCVAGENYPIQQNPTGGYGLTIGSEGENIFCQTVGVNCDIVETICNDEIFIVWAGDLVQIDIEGDYSGSATLVGALTAQSLGVTDLLGGDYFFYQPPAGFVGSAQVTLVYTNFEGVVVSEVTYCIQVEDC